jgi:cytochrome P450
MNEQNGSLSELDVISPEAYGAAGYPHAAWARLRREAPVFLVEQKGFDPFWAITRHADIVSISKQPERFVNAPRMTMMHNSVRPPEAVRKDPGFKSMIRTLLNMDNPDHRTYRKLVSGWFTPRAIQRLERRVEAIVGGILDDLETRQAQGTCDFVAEIAARVPLRVIAEILGVPHEDEGFVLRLSNQGIGAQDPEFQVEGKSVREARRAALIELFAYFSDLAEQRRAQPRDDLATVLANASVNGAPLPQIELLSYFGLIAVAGHETTRNATSGGMAALLDHPDQWRRLRDDPSLVGSAAEEILRWTSPVIQFTRTAIEDTEIRGRQVRSGDVLVVFYPSANRDEEVFDNAHRFRVDRDPNPHIAFGIGEHLCLGAHLARLELREIFRQLAQRLQAIELAGARQFLVSSFVGGIKHLPVRYQFRSVH